MGLLLQMPTPIRPDEGAAPAYVGVVATTAVQPARAGRLPQRDQLKAAHQARIYESVIRRRLSLIPVPPRYAPGAIVSRLREVDGQIQNRARANRRLELQTDMTILGHNIERPSREEARRGRRTRRLSNVWDFLTTHTEFIKMLIGEREGRLQYNVETFFRSDLPASYLADFGSSTRWEIAALALANNASSQRLVQRLTGRPVEEVNKGTFTAVAAPLQEVDRAFREYRRRIDDLTAISDNVLSWRDALEYYVDLYSAPGLRAFREPRAISVSALDRGVLDELMEGLRSATAHLRRTLAAEYSGLSEFQWLPRDDPFLTGIVRLELEAAEAG